MEEKVLGKISWAEFGTVKEYPFLIGLQLGFSIDGRSGIYDGGSYTVNIDSNCKSWSSPEERAATIITYVALSVKKVLDDAKVNYVSELVGKPVEVLIENNTFKDFRILTEVL